MKTIIWVFCEIEDEKVLFINKLFKDKSILKLLDLSSTNDISLLNSSSDKEIKNFIKSNNKALMINGKYDDIKLDNKYLKEFYKKYPNINNKIILLSSNQSSAFNDLVLYYKYFEFEIVILDYLNNYNLIQKIDLRDFVYDLYFPCGPGCRSAEYLRERDLRKCAFPFDWQITNFISIIHHMETGFVDFFNNYKDITSEKPDDYEKAQIIDNDYYCMCVHYVEKNEDLDLAIKRFKELTYKRYKRLDSLLKKADRICLLTYDMLKISRLRDILLRFSKLYPNKKITLVDIYSINKDIKVKKYKIDYNLSIVRYYFEDTLNNVDNWTGNRAEWEKVINNYYLNEEFYNNDEIQKLIKN